MGSVPTATDEPPSGRFRSDTAPPPSPNPVLLGRWPRPLCLRSSAACFSFAETLLAPRSHLLLLGVCVCPRGGPVPFLQVRPWQFLFSVCPLTRSLRGHILSRAFSGTEGPASARLPVRRPTPACLSLLTPFPALYRSALWERETRAHAHQHQRPPHQEARATGLRARGSSCEPARELTRSRGSLGNW